MGKTWENRSLGKSIRRQDNNIKMHLQEMGWGMGFIDLVKDRGRLRGSCECGNEPQGSLKCGQFLEWLKTC